MKKKLENAYAPDKDARKERIVVGLSGGIDSMVTAYLLKIQKYDLFAVTVVSGWDQFSGNKSQALACHIDDAKLESIKEFCHQLKIPHHVIRANTEFQETVVEEWMAAKVTGTTSNACWNCHALRMNLLYQKMLELEVKNLATGHYAKIFHHAADDTYYVHTSNDEENDQSSLLNRLPTRILSSLMLPLSDLQKKEVLKLSENFGLKLEDGLIKMHGCFPVNAETIQYLAQRIPKSMAQEGNFVSDDGTEIYGDHEGILNHSYGEEIKLEKRTEKEALFVAHFYLKDKRIVLKRESYFMRSCVHLIDCSFSEEVSWPEPMKAVVEVSEGNFVDCWVHPKSQRTAFVEWEGPQKTKAGEMLTVYKKKGKNAKVYLTGKVRFLPQKVIPQGNEEEVPEVDYGKDF